MTEAQPAIRYGTSALPALAVTSALCLVMQSLLVAPHDRSPGDTLAFPSAEIVPAPPVEPVAIEPPPDLPEIPPAETAPPGVAAAPTKAFDLPVISMRPGKVPVVGIPGGETGALIAPDGGPTLLYLPQPFYPTHAERRGLEGYVVLEFTVRRDGTVGDARVVEASPQGVFDRAALNAVVGAQYQPRTVNGDAVAAGGVRAMYTFQLEEK